MYFNNLNNLIVLYVYLFFDIFNFNVYIYIFECNMERKKERENILFSKVLLLLYLIVFGNNK